MSTKSAQEAAAAKAEAVFFEALDAATVVNIRISKYYAAGIVGLIALFTLVHWTHIIFVNTTKRSNPVGRACSIVTTPIKRLLTGYAAGSLLVLPGRILLALAYFGINIGLMFAQLNFDYNAVFIAKRCGWLALCNMCVTIFLALKNTPLSPLIGRSYEKINVLHQCAGYTTIVAMLLHSAIFIQSLVKGGGTFLLMITPQYAAIFAGFCFLTIGVTASSFFRSRLYELFFVTHVTLVAGILIALIFHLKAINWNALAALIFAALLWFADRTLRFTRWLFYGYANYCNLTALPEGATRVTMHRSVKAQPGSHAFLWIPSIRRFQTHPFTLVSNNPAEFVITGYDGFTKELHALALKDPKALRRAAIEGPYGNMPSTADYDKLLLIAGGPGATFTLALAMDWLRVHRKSNGNRFLEFVWVVKNEEYLSWFEDELWDLQSSPCVNLRIHVTAQKMAKGNISWPSSSASDERKSLSSSASPTGSRLSSLRDGIKYGRPNVDALVMQVVNSTNRDGRVLAAAAGPAGLLADTRMAVRDCMSSHSASIHMHLEEFDGW